MTIKFPESRKEVADRAKADVNSNLPTANAFLKNSYLGALITGYAGRVYEFYLQLKNALLEMFPDTATGTYLERWGSYVSINRLAPTSSEGYVRFTGTPGTTVPVGLSLSDAEGNTYTTTTSGTVNSGTLSIISLTRSGTTATAITSSGHGLATGAIVTVAGASPSGYNGIFTVTVTNEAAFEYTVSGALSTPATGTITAVVTGIEVIVTSDLTGSSTNLDHGTELTLNVAVPGLDSTPIVSWGGLNGGTDIETDTEYRSRVLYRYQQPLALFNTVAITNVCRAVNGVTRVFVKEAGDTYGAVNAVTSITRTGNVALVTVPNPHYMETGQRTWIQGALPTGYNGYVKILALTDYTFAYYVDSALSSSATGTITYSRGIPAGQVKVYIMADDNVDPFPGANIVTKARQAVLDIKPAHVSSYDVFVSGPIRQNVDFVFTDLDPITNKMKSAIEKALKAAIDTNADVGGTIPEAAYISAIWQAVSESGEVVRDFTLSTPSGDITVAEGALPVLNSITWPT